MLLHGKNTAIVGGGPGGLTLARLLQMAGGQVKVYERDFGKAARVQGATLDLHADSGLKALEQANLLDDFYNHYRPEAGRLRVTDHHAVIYMDEHANDSGVADDRPEIDRGPLRNILLDALQPDTVVWNSHFASMQPSGSGWLLQFKNGSSAYADLVIAADGANSRLRPYITEIAPVYSGVTIVEGNVYDAAKNAPELYTLVQGGKLFALGREQSLILSAKGDGTLSFYTGCKVPEHWVKMSGIDYSNKAKVSAWFRSAFDGWGDIWMELFAGDEVSFIARPQYHFPLGQSWCTLSNLTIIGDAAHRMPPYAGEGVNMAMLDALELSLCLTGNEFSSMKEAIAQYEQQMQRRAAAITAITLDSTAMLHAPDALQHLLQLFSGRRQ